MVWAITGVIILVVLAIVAGVIFSLGVFAAFQGFIINLLQTIFPGKVLVAGIVFFIILLLLVFALPRGRQFLVWVAGALAVYLAFSLAWNSGVSEKASARLATSSKKSGSEKVEKISDGLIQSVEVKRTYVAGEKGVVAYLDINDLKKMQNFSPGTVFYRLREPVEGNKFTVEVDYFVKEVDGQPGHFFRGEKKDWLIFVVNDLETSEGRKQRLAAEESARNAALEKIRQNNKRQEAEKKAEKARAEAAERERRSILALAPTGEGGGEHQIFNLPPNTQYGDSFKFLEAVPVAGIGGGNVYVGNESVGTFSTVIPAGFSFRVPREAVIKNGAFKLLISSVNARKINEIKIKKEGGA